MISQIFTKYRPLLLGALGLIVVTGFIFSGLALLDKAELRTATQIGGHISKIHRSGGVVHVHNKDIKEVLEPMAKRLLVDLDLVKIQSTLEEMPWVRKVSVARIYPNILKVHVEEQRPVARWNESEFLNPWGEIFTVPAFEGSDNLVAIKGYKGQEKQALHYYVKVSGLFKGGENAIATLHQSKQGSYGIRFTDGLTVIVGRHHVETRLNRLNKILKLYKKYPNKVTYIDLRYRKGFAIKMKQKQGAKNV